MPELRRLAAVALVLFAAAAACKGGAGAQGQGGAASAAPKLSSSQMVARVRIFLIAPGSDGQGSAGGQDAGAGSAGGACGGGTRAVEVPAAQAGPALPAALGELLAMHQPSDPASGLRNPLYAARLQLAGIDRRGSQAVVRLTGYVERGSDCDNRRMLAQLTATAMQFADVAAVTFEIDGHPLDELLAAGGGTPAPAP